MSRDTQPLTAEPFRNGGEVIALEDLVVSDEEAIRKLVAQNHDLLTTLNQEQNEVTRLRAHIRELERRLAKVTKRAVAAEQGLETKKRPTTSSMCGHVAVSEIGEESGACEKPKGHDGMHKREGVGSWN